MNNADKDIMPRNEKGRLHGYYEDYWNTGELYFKGVYLNGLMCGYFETYYDDGSIREDWTGYFLGNRVSSDNEEGNCYIWNRVIV